MSLVVSLIGITFLIWYVIHALKKLQFMSTAFESLDLDIQAFEKHLKTIHELEMYYGDQTLQALIKHSKALLESFTEIRKDYEIFNGDIQENDYLLEEEVQDKEEKNKE